MSELWRLRNSRSCVVGFAFEDGVVIGPEQVVAVGWQWTLSAHDHGQDEHLQGSGQESIHRGAGDGGIEARQCGP